MCKTLKCHSLLFNVNIDTLKFNVYCTITTNSSSIWNFFLAEMAQNYSFDLRQIKKIYFFFDVMCDVTDVKGS